MRGLRDLRDRIPQMPTDPAPSPSGPLSPRPAPPGPEARPAGAAPPPQPASPQPASPQPASPQPAAPQHAASQHAPPLPLDPEVARRKALRLARQRLAEIFTPARPVAGRSFRLHGGSPDGAFVGRVAERDLILRALLEDRAHVLLYGERGLGKTSLANLAVAQVPTTETDVLRHVCSAGSDFDSILRGLAEDLPRLPGAPAAPGLDPRTELAAALPARRLRPGDVVAAFGALRRRTVCVIDEFDRVTDPEARTALADTIKQTSDRRIALSFVIIGVSDDAEALLGRHPSIQRCLARIPLPLLTDAEVGQIAARGDEAGLAIPASARAGIAGLSRGVPYMAQLLSLRAGQAALDAGRTDIRGADLLAAIRAAVAEADPRVQILYERVTAHEQDAAALALLRAAAAGPRDEFGRFAALREGGVLKVAAMPVEEGAWHRLVEAGAVRPARQGGRILYVFGEPMLPHYVLHRAVLARQGGAG